MTMKYILAVLCAVAIGWNSPANQRDDERNQKTTMSVSISANLGNRLDVQKDVGSFPSDVDKLAIFIKECVKGVDGAKLDVRCVAYCLKTDLRRDGIPATRAQYLFRIEQKIAKKFTYVFAFKSQQGWRKCSFPSIHGEKFDGQIDLDGFDPLLLQEFLEGTTFGFYDYDVSDVESLIVASNSRRELPFLRQPWTDSERVARAGLFLVPE